MHINLSDAGSLGNQLPSKDKLVLRSLLTLVVLLSIVALGLGRQFYTEALEDAFFGLALASAVILHQRIRPSWMDAAWLLIGTAAFGAIDFHFLHYPQRVMAWFSFLGLSSFAIMILRSIWSEERTKWLYAWIPAAAFVTSDYFASNMLEWTSKAHPKTLDLYLLSFDGSLRAQIAFGAGQLFARVPALHIIGLIAYIGLAIPITTVYAGRLARFKEGAFPAMLAFLLTGPIGILFYNLFPACGPHRIFGPRFPFDPLPLADVSRVLLEPVAIEGPRNAIPSLHLAWTLLAWWYSRGLSKLERIVAFGFLALTAFATLGTGEHWFVDLVVAFPFALLMYSLCMYQLSWKDPRRSIAVLLGLGTTLAWFVMLRYGSTFFWISPILPWTVSAATVLFAYMGQAKLDRALDAQGRSLERSERLRWFDLNSAVVPPQ